jgi:hypothetical protein
LKRLCGPFAEPSKVSVNLVDSIIKPVYFIPYFGKINKYIYIKVVLFRIKTINIKHKAFNCEIYKKSLIKTNKNL